MRIRRAAVAGLVFAMSAAFAGCSDPVEDARRELEIVESSGGSTTDICVAQEKVADALLKAHEAKAYEEAKARAAVTCLNAGFERQFGPSAAPPNQPQPAA